MDVIWVYGFSLNPMEWNRKGSSLTGSFSQIALGIMDDGIFIAYIDGQGQPGVLRHGDNERFDLATRDQLPVDKDRECVAVRPIRGMRSTFVLVIRDENASRLLIMQYSGEPKRWRTVQSVRIGSTSEISAVAVGKKVYYAYQTYDEGKALVKVGQTAIPQD